MAKTKSEELVSTSASVKAQTETQPVVEKAPAPLEEKKIPVVVARKALIFEVLDNDRLNVVYGTIDGNVKLSTSKTLCTDTRYIQAYAEVDVIVRNLLSKQRLP